MLRRSHTFVLELEGVWKGAFATEPCEVAWATEAVIFLRTTDVSNMKRDVHVRVQISPDGIHWCDEGTTCVVPTEPGVTFCRLSRFGGWLRLAGELQGDSEVKVTAYVALKG